METVLILLILAAVFVAIKGCIIVEQQEVVIVQRLGKYKETLGAGLNFIVPFIDSPKGIYRKVSTTYPDGRTYSYMQKSSRLDLRETVYDFPRQNVITKDNVSISINAVLYFQIINPEKAVYGVENLSEAIEKLTQTTLRQLIGKLELQETLVSRDKINEELRAILDTASDKWGVKVNRIELQDITPPADIQAAMDKQMKAEREKRAMIYEAEGEKNLPSASPKDRKKPPSVKPRAKRNLPFSVPKVSRRRAWSRPKRKKKPSSVLLRLCHPKDRQTNTSLP